MTRIFIFKDLIKIFKNLLLLYKAYILILLIIIFIYKNLESYQNKIIKTTKFYNILLKMFKKIKKNYLTKVKIFVIKLIIVF
jgi:hypothetical protein